MKKIILSLTILSLIILASKAITKIEAVNTNLSATISGGSLTLSNSTAIGATFDSKSVSASEQTTTTNIGDTDSTNTTGVEVTDLRGTGVGWAATMTATNLVTQGVVKLLSGSNTTVGFTGTYTGMDAIFTTNGFYTVEITTGGSVGVAVFTWTDPIGIATTNVTTASSVALSNGINVTFDPATYAVGDKWSIAVDALRYNYNTTKGLTVAPGTILAISGVTNGMTAGSMTLLTGSGTTSNPVTILTAPTNAGMGDYFIDLGLSQTIHPNSFTGIYTSTVTLTVS
jgi:hypothetical protein